MTHRVSQVFASVVERRKGDARVTIAQAQVQFDSKNQPLLTSQVFSHFVTEDKTLPVKTTQLFTHFVTEDKTLPIEVSQFLAGGVFPLSAGLTLATIPIPDDDFIEIDSIEVGYPPRFILDERERNPYSTQYAAVDLDEQQRTIRDQHNVTQAGDTTFDYGLLLRHYPDPLFTLGSLGRFYYIPREENNNEDYGLIHARFVKFVDWVPVEFQGCPVGRLRNNDIFNWEVTNDFELSDPELVMGMTFLAESPPDGSYGWVVVDGPNVTNAKTTNPLVPAPDTPYVWTGTGELGIGVTGKVMARRAGRARSPAVRPGTIYIRTEGLSPASFAEQVQEVLQVEIAAIAALQVRVTDLENDFDEIATSSTSLSSVVDRFQTQLTRESQARARDIQSIRNELGAVDYGPEITSALNTARAEFAAADGNLRTQIASARFVAEQALSAANSGVPPVVSEQIEALNNQIAGFSQRLINFRVNYPTPVGDEILVSVVTTGGDGETITDFVPLAYKLESLFDVDVTTAPPADGDQLTWDDSAGLWVPGSPGSGGGGGSIAVEEDSSSVVASATILNFTGAGVAVTDLGSGEAQIDIPGGGGGGSLAWTLAGTWTHSTNVSEVVFTGLGDYRELLIHLVGVTASNSVFRAIQFSANNGASWITTDYVNYDSNGNLNILPEAIFPHGLSTTAARSFVSMITGFNEAVPTVQLTTARGRVDLNTQLTAMNALRVIPSNGVATPPLGTFNAGSIRVYGR